MTRRILLSLGAGFFVCCAIWLSLVLCAPDLNNERGGAVMFYSSIAATVATFISLWFSEHLLMKSLSRTYS